MFLCCFALSEQPMANYARYGIAVAIIVGIVCGHAFGVLEDVDRNVLGLNLPYGRGLVSWVQERFFQEKGFSLRSRVVNPETCHDKQY